MRLREEAYDARKCLEAESDQVDSESPIFEVMGGHPTRLLAHQLSIKM